VETKTPTSWMSLR